jgi:hypothetical protein
LVKVELCAVRKSFGRITRISNRDCRKKACLSHYKKSIFRPLEKDAFFALSEKRQGTPVSINKDGRLIKTNVLVFIPNQVKNPFKKNIVSNLPWITDLKVSSDRMEASMKTDDRRLRTPTGAVRGGVEDGGNGEKAPSLCAALCRVLLAWDRRGKAESRRTLPPQSMTIWAILKYGTDSARLARGWREEPKMRLKTCANTWIHVRKTFLNVKPLALAWIRKASALLEKKCWSLTSNDLG